MINSWVSGALRGLFGIADETGHWKAVEKAMEESLGKIKVDIPIEGGPVRAFFEQQTLLGDDSQLHKHRYKHTLICLDMVEAVGKGKTREAAIVALWNKVTHLMPGETILRYEEPISNGEPHAWYTRFHFEKGVFINVGRTTNEQPPARSSFIDRFLDNERRTQLIGQIEEEVFSSGPKGSGN